MWILELLRRDCDCIHETGFTKAGKINECDHMGDLETSWTKRASHSGDPSAAVCKEQKQDKLYNACLAVNTLIHS